MHLDVPGSIEYFYVIQVALTFARAAKRPSANLSARFHQDIKFCSNLCAKMIDRPTYLAKLVYRPASDLGCTNCLGKGDRGVWIDQNKEGKNYTV